MRAGEIVIAIRATIGKALPVPPELEGANLTQGTARFAPKADIDSKYALYLLRSNAVQNQIDINTKGTTFSEITLADLRRVRVPFVRREGEQLIIAAAVEKVNISIEEAKKDRAKLKRQKLGLMQDLLTGKVSVEPLLEREPA